MGVLSFCLSRWRRRAATVEVSAPAPQQHELPLSFAELVAASAFLDFGGMLDERQLSGRPMERNGMEDRPGSGTMPRPSDGE